MVPSLSSQQPQGPKVRRQAKGSSLRPDVSPEPLYHLATSPHTPGMMDRARGLLAAGRSPKVSTPARKPPAGAGAAAGAAGTIWAAAAAGAGAGADAAGTSSPARQSQHAGAGGAGDAGGTPAQQQPVLRQPTQQQQEEQIQQPAQRPDEGELQQQDAPAVERSSSLRLLLSHSHSCSFSNLPESLQQLLNSGDGRRKRRKSRPKLTRYAQQQQQQPQSQPPDQQQHEAEQGGIQPQQPQSQQRQVVGDPVAVGALQASSRAESLVFGDIDSSVYRRLSNESAAGHAAAAATAAAGDADGSSSESGSGSESDSNDDGTSSRRVSGAGASDMQRATSEETESSGEEEGPSLRSQLLLGHLLLMASDAVAGGAAAGVVSTASGSTAGTATSSGLGLGLGSVSGSSVSLQPAGLQVLAGHLHRAGLLPKWVYWLLKQMPQRPELYERAFNRLFQQVGTGIMQRCHLIMHQVVEAVA